jgi:hypothetical protein
VSLRSGRCPAWLVAAALLGGACSGDVEPAEPRTEVADAGDADVAEVVHSECWGIDSKAACCGHQRPNGAYCKWVDAAAWCFDGWSDNCLRNWEVTCPPHTHCVRYPEADGDCGYYVGLPSDVGICEQE